MAALSEVRLDGQDYLNSPIDMDALSTNTFGNRDLEFEVLRMFKAQSHSMMRRIGTEMTPALRKDLVHTLKGSAKAIGALQLSLICEALEAEYADDQDPSLISLQTAIGDVNSYIDNLLDR